MHSRAALFEVSAHQVDEIFGEFRRNLLLCAIREMKANMGFQHFRHEAIYTAAHSGQQHKLIVALAAGGEGAFNGVELAAQLADPLDHFDRFAFLMGHENSSLLIPTPGIVCTVLGYHWLGIILPQVPSRPANLIRKACSCT